MVRYKLNELGADSTDAFAKIFDTSHIETEQYYINILLEDLKPIVYDLRNTHMKDSNTASDIDYQSMVKNIIDDFTSPTQITTEDTHEASNDAYINGLLLLFCKNLEMKITQLSVEEKQTLKEIFSRSKPVKEHRKLGDEIRSYKVKLLSFKTSHRGLFPLRLVVFITIFRVVFKFLLSLTSYLIF